MTFAACILGLLAILIGAFLAAATSAQRTGYRQDEHDGRGHAG